GATPTPAALRAAVVVFRNRLRSISISFQESIRLSHLACRDGAQLAYDALGGKDHDQDESDAEHRLPELGIGTDDILQRDDCGRADKGAEQRANATCDHHEHALNRLRQRHRRWADKIVEHRIKRTGYSGKESRHRKANEQMQRDVVSEASHPAFAVADAAQCQPKRRAYETPH